MFTKIVLRIVLAILLVAVIIGAGVYIYQIGVTQGLASSGLSLTQEDGNAVLSPLYAPLYRPWGLGFFPFGWIIPLFFGLLLFGFISRLLFGNWRRRPYGPWNGRHWGGRMSGWDPQNVPPFVEDWHRRMHGETVEKAGEES